MELSSFFASTKGRAREVPEEVDTDWDSIKARAHKMLGGSSFNSNHTIQTHVREEHSSTSPVSNGETGIIQSTNGKNKKSLLEEENPSQTMVTEQGDGNARKQIPNLFSNSQMKGNGSGTTIFNMKGTTVSSSSCQGDAKGISLGKSKLDKAETTSRTAAGSRKEKTDNLMAVSSGHACPRCGSILKNERNDEEDEEDSSGSIKKKVKTRKLTSIYADSRSLMPISSEVNETEEPNRKLLDIDLNK